ncbi:MAG: hypothetical protein IPF58_04920 [Saprospirales bacterium]|nr:hypothetical protein [Saprospirales bacterium]
MVDGFDLAGGGEGYFGLTVRDNGPYPANDLICGIALQLQRMILALLAGGTVAADVGSVTNITKTGTNIKGTNCFDPNPNFTAGADCPVVIGANYNDNAVWYKLPIATNRKDILIKGVTSGDILDMQYALYEAQLQRKLQRVMVQLSLVSNGSHIIKI